MSDSVDLLIVGGGINGCGIARDAAGRGLSVMLVEQGDLAQGTSSASTKLIHGGLRYLEYYEFRLVREALRERETLLAMAPHIIRPMRFVLPHESHLRPAWMIRAGLFLYDHLGGRRRLPGSKSVDLGISAEGQPLKDGFRKGFVYSDCWVEDARLVVLNAMDARARGARILTRTQLIEAEREDGLWRAVIWDESLNAEREVTARVLVNAAGPWVAEVLDQKLGRPAHHGVRLVKGSHIVVPKLFEGDQAYILQNPDRRVIFVIPYEGRFTLVGTTDSPFEGDPKDVTIGEDEIDYLAASVSRYFKTEVTRADVVWTYSGVRPLQADEHQSAAATTRDYLLELDATKDEAPLLSVIGGKITTFRRLAEHAMEKLAPFFQGEGYKPWTSGAVLPGGDIPDLDMDAYLATTIARWSFLPPELARRLVRAYGTRIEGLMGDAAAMDDLGPDLGGGLHAREVDYLVREEWAHSADDILWRRSKLGLHVPAGTRLRLAHHLTKEGADS